jgi:hypothetical protein
VQIADGNDNMKLFRPRNYPVLRGYALLIGDEQASGRALATEEGSDEPAPLVSGLREAKAGLEREQAQRRRPPAALVSIVGEEVSRNSFSSMCRASC